MNYATIMKKFQNLHFARSIVLFLLCHLTSYGGAGGGIPGIELLMPPSHVALSGDLRVQIISASFTPLILQLSRLEGILAQPLTTISVLPEASALANNSTVVNIPCGYFSRGGQYYVLLKKQPIGRRNFTRTYLDVNQDQDAMIIRSLDVRWPMPQLTITPEHLQTYPEQPAMAILEFPDVKCPPVVDNYATAIPEFWLELHYCGHSLLTCNTDSAEAKFRNNSEVLYSEQVRGFPGRRIITLRCELFGLAGHYGLFLKPTISSSALPPTAAYVKADWSEQFVFNVHARSIFPCDVHGGGIIVLFQYPSCILAAGDRVRLFGKLRLDVASLAPPTTMEYVAEQRVVRGQHKLHFDCNLFTERYVEYCFVYVSQAITGAVADVRMDCVPTLPISDQERGGWGPWSQWSPCSSSCFGTRTRYRFCDSPPPRYGAKFCEGQSVETERCGTGLSKSWECIDGGGSAVAIGGDIAAVMPEVQEEVGLHCRCGCVVHLGLAKPKRLLAASSQSCPGRTFWLIQADEDFIIQFRVEQFRLPCGTQWLKIRDGNSLSSNLLADLWGGRDTQPSIVNSTGPNLLLEYFSDEVFAVTTSMARPSCGGGFVGQAIQTRYYRNNITAIPVAHSIGLVPAVVLKLSAIHIAAIFFLSGLLLATILLGAQYLFRYRKYHIAKAEDQDSLTDPHGSTNSIPITTRATSNATLLSEVISMTKLRPHMNPRNKHIRLRESVDCESAAEGIKGDNRATLADEEDSLSTGSNATITPQERSAPSSPQNQSSGETTSVKSGTPSTPQVAVLRQLSRSSTTASDKDNSTEKDEVNGVVSKDAVRRHSNVSNVTMTHVSVMSELCSKSDPGCYSSASSRVSTATIRSTNAKETKEKRNREKLLAGPAGSDISLAPQDMDLEMDYYDYNVVNAGAAPGSYLGMDPAFLVWIPPLDETGEILGENGEEYHEMEHLHPKIYIDPGSNKESPDEEDVLLPKIKSRSVSESTLKGSPILRAKNRRVLPMVFDDTDNRYKSEVVPLVHNSKNISIQLQEFPKKLLTASKYSLAEMEKETKVEKSPSLCGDYLSGIKFADDEEEDLAENQCNIDRSYQDLNIISSS